MTRPNENMNEKKIGSSSYSNVVAPLPGGSLHPRCGGADSQASQDWDAKEGEIHGERRH